jgi:hypothetical protein
MDLSPIPPQSKPGLIPVVIDILENSQYQCALDKVRIRRVN